MPSPNLVKQYASQTFYHIYNRGVEKRQIFLDRQDYNYFLYLLGRYLNGQGDKDSSGRLYEDLSGVVEIAAYCLMPNHFHILLYQLEPDGMTRLFRRVMTGYAMYFNQKYKRIGSLFQDRFKASIITNEGYLWNISRYVHQNPLDLGIRPETYPYSSLKSYTGGHTYQWVKPDRILAMHNETGNSYEAFMMENISPKYHLAGFLAD